MYVTLPKGLEGMKSQEHAHFRSTKKTHRLESISFLPIYHTTTYFH